MVVEPAFRKPPPEGDGTEPPKPKRFWWRFLLGSFLIVVAVAGATSASGILFFNDFANALSHNDRYHKLQRLLANVNGGEPENILILGSDKRASTPGDPGRSDTTMLLRLDPDRNAIALMSIPRDLKVEIPGWGTEKFNAAYTYGGPKLTLRVVKELTGLPINHVVNVDFLGFVRAVDAIGCVYVDVDRRYYHSNAESSEEYAEINVQPGYQLLCGKKALQYVRYRHTDTDLVRAARQQDFLSAARQRVPVLALFTDRDQLLDIFTEYTTSDISDGETALEVLKLFIDSRNAEIHEVHFPAELGPSFVTASPEAIEGAVAKFLGIEASEGSRGTLEDEPENQQGNGGAKKKAKRRKKREKPRVAAPKLPGSDELVHAREAGEIEAKIVARKVSGGFPVFFPTRLPSGAAYVETNPYLKVVDPRVYHFKDTDGNRHAAYRMVVAVDLSDGTHYFGVQGIRGWSDPPILSEPSETREIHGREYEIYIDGDRVDVVAWHRGDNSYWIANDLLNTLTNDQMLGMARSADVIVPNPKPKRGGAVRGGER
jgi:polyisoprenyl-teichoic acid--peptidoglycan teichoic acid transferase